MRINRMILERLRDAQRERCAGRMNAYAELFAHVHRDGPWVQTRSGRAYPLLAPTTEDICIEDIAYSLAGLPRFNAHTKRSPAGRLYTVGQHSVLASKIVAGEHAFEALMHDAAEAYVGDMTRPLRLCLPDFDLVEHITWLAIARKFGLPQKLSAEVKHADLVMLVTEKRDLLGVSPRPWAQSGPDLLPDTISIWSPGSVEDAFLLRFKQLELST